MKSINLSPLCSRFPKMVDARRDTAARRISSAARRMVWLLWRLARRRPLVSALALLTATYWGMSFWRGEERTHRDMIHVARRVQDALTIAPSLNESQGLIESGRAPVSEPVLRYSARFINLARRDHRQREDSLASFEALESAWQSVAGNRKLTVQVIVPSTLEPTTGRWAKQSWHAPQALDRSNFEEMLPVLKEIHTLIVEVDGSGRGRLGVSGYQAEPVDDPGDWGRDLGRHGGRLAGPTRGVDGAAHVCPRGRARA
jgi:hypothetical protein